MEYISDEAVRQKVISRYICRINLLLVTNLFEIIVYAIFLTL